ncbi:MAG: toll/interleukin-1 receptor domain-containing protein [Betaproteobacteria bacterium]|nr:toll/interleukin-1 receptor domain-containing protein [Betaproteobacteria bacterium]
MYLARFSDGERSWVQGLARVRPLRGGLEAMRQWTVTLEYGIREINALPEAFRSRRLSYFVKEGPELLYSVMCPAERETRLRTALGTFARLDRHIADTVEMPTDAKQFEEWQAEFPRWRGLVRSPRYRSGSSWLACPFRVQPLLPALLQRARALGHGFSLQANLQSCRPARAALREAMLNCKSLEERPGVSISLIAAQRAACDTLARTQTLGVEILGAPSPEAVAWLRGEIQASFSEKYAVLGFPNIEFEFESLAWQEELGTGVCQDLVGEEDASALASSALDSDDCIRMLGYPSELLAHLPAVIVEDPDAPVSIESSEPTPAPAMGQGPYAFVSYQHGDSGDVARLVDLLVKNGVHVWYDRGIPGGTEWDAVIEERIRECSALLLVLSDRAVRSRYVRREVKYADTLGKPILTAQLSDAHLAAGMAMLLLQYQMIDLRAEGARDALLRDLTRLMRI